MSLHCHAWFPALEQLLDSWYCNELVRAFAVTSLEKASDTVLAVYLQPLVQVSDTVHIVHRHIPWLCTHAFQAKIWEGSVCRSSLQPRWIRGVLQRLA